MGYILAQNLFLRSKHVHLTQDSTFNSGRCPAWVLSTLIRRRVMLLSLLRRKTAEGRVYPVGLLRALTALPPALARCCCRTVIWVITAATALQRTLYPAWDPHGRRLLRSDADNEIVHITKMSHHHHDAQWLENGNPLATAASPLLADIAARVTGISVRDAPDGAIALTSSKRSIATVKWFGNGVLGILGTFEDSRFMIFRPPPLADD